MCLDINCSGHVIIKITCHFGDDTQILTSHSSLKIQDSQHSQSKNFQKVSCTSWLPNGTKQHDSPSVIDSLRPYNFKVKLYCMIYNLEVWPQI